MSTRAAAATTSRAAKQDLVRLLFSGKYSRRGRDAHRMLDYSMYTHDQLRSAYLERVHEIHPDKWKASSGEVKIDAEEAKKHFVELQEAWVRYENLARMMRRVTGGGTPESSFTMFGVGCSFSDNDSEKALRAEITDQACKGWFPAGQLAQGTGEESVILARRSNQVSLIDDSLFELAGEKDRKGQTDSVGSANSRYKLVSHLMKPQR